MADMLMERHWSAEGDRHGLVLCGGPGVAARQEVDRWRRGIRMFKFRLALLLLLLYAGTMLRAQGNSEAAHVRALNNSLLNIYGQLNAADRSQGNSLHSQASQVI